MYQFNSIINGNSFSITSSYRIDYVPSLNVYLASGYYSGTGCTLLFYSYDCINWTGYAPSSYSLYSSVTYFPNSNMVVAFGWTGTSPGCPFLTLDLNNYNIPTNYNIGNLSNMSLTNSTVISNALNININNTSIGGSWSSICWSSKLGIFVGVSDTGGTTTNSVIVSSNGISWTKYNSANINKYYGICWSPELSIFVAVGLSSTSANSFMTSTNGTTWTEITFASSNNYTSICWSPDLSMFVAVATGGYITISSDGRNWNTIASSFTNNWTSICWCKYLGLFVAVGSSGTGNRVITSPDGITWTSRSSASDSNWLSVCYNIYSNIIVAVAGSTGSSQVMTSNDGINWAAQSSPQYNGSNTSWSSVCWMPELNTFIATSVSDYYTYMTSSDGITWSASSVSSNTINFKSVCWSSELNMCTSLDSTYSLVSTQAMPAPKSTIMCNSNVMNIDQGTGYLGMGGILTPTYQLHLSSDSAAKPSTSTWTVSSDERLKNNIQNADLDMCYNNIKNLRLVKYTWKDEVYSVDQVTDRSKLGWIAQEVEQIYPKAVEKVNMHGYEDCRTLNTDQIIASMYGCLQKIMTIYDDQTIELTSLETNITTVQKTIDDLTKP